MCTFFILRETHAPTLKRKIYGSNGLKSNGNDQEETGGVIDALKQALMRPLKMLVKSPVVMASCILIFIVIGLLNVFLTELSRTVQDVYNVSSGQSGVMYLGLALGFVAASVLFGLTNDRIMHALARRHDGETKPEFRLPATMAAMPVCAALATMHQYQGLIWPSSLDIANNLPNRLDSHYWNTVVRLDDSLSNTMGHSNHRKWNRWVGHHNGAIVNHHIHD